jgi:Fe-S cluster assembly protein SufD
VAHPLERFTAEWERAGQQRGGEPDALAQIRRRAWDRFLSLGFPTTREEEWRFTSVAPIAEGDFALAPQAPAAISPAAADGFRLDGAAAELVFVNGRYSPALSRRGSVPAGVRVESLRACFTPDDREAAASLARTASFEQHAFAALNTAFLDDGACVRAAAGTVLEAPIHLLFLATEAGGGRSIMAHPRVLLLLGANTQAAVVETYAGAGGARYFTNAVTEIVLGENAVLDHYKLQYESPTAHHVGAIHVRASRSAACASHSISAGGALVRNDIVAVLDGEGVECTLNGLYLADARRLIDNHTTIDHARPHCASREIYKGILADRARGVFNGKIVVRPDAQKTDAKQTNRALLLSEDALINTKPQLEIFANDVKCTHGAAVGQLDADALFYLRSRGLSEPLARQLLIHAFAGDVLNRLPLASIREAVERRLQRDLARMLPVAA